MEILKIKNLSFTYPLCSQKVLDGISLSVERGELLCVCGATGSGKTTFLRMLKRELIPLGERTGSIEYNGCLPEELPERVTAAEIGFVMQRPEQQLVTDRVWHELAFGLENLNVPSAVINRRIAETAAYFGIEGLFDREVSTLSGGQKQLLNLAAVTVMNPKIIILDEPTAQLDPIAASEFLSVLKKLNRELGMTVIISEHRTEEIIPAASRLLIIEKGRVAGLGTPSAVIGSLPDSSAQLRGMPAAARLFRATHGSGECPLDVRGGRDYAEGCLKNEIRALPEPPTRPGNRAALQFSDVYFRYSKDGADVLDSVELTVHENEIFCILGGNGSGKSTLLSAAAGLIKPISGEIKVFGKPLRKYPGRSLYSECLALLPQDVQTVFLKDTVRSELENAGAGVSLLPVDISPLYQRHPYDLSGGEQQLVALAEVLAAKPRLLLLDEPTKGLDAEAAAGLAGVLRKLRAGGMTVVIVTHDIEFAAGLADRCALLFRGRIVSSGETHGFLSENNLYTTAVSRMTRGFYDNAVTLEDAVRLWNLNGGRQDV